MTGIPTDPAWLWLIGGVVLLIAELIAPGYFLMFIGAAGIATGLLALVLPIGVALQFALFAILAITAVRLGGRYAYSYKYEHSTDPLLNDRAGRLLGRLVVAEEPIDRDGGRVRVGDSVWPARGGPAAVGDRVRIVDVEGNCLKVEPEHALPPPSG
jgi:membrane protein implicated in regulation of membrane protease activity